METIKSSRQKALEINLDLRYYGVFAEIGAGQEVARHFFQAGAASQTIAKTISAYDMIYSDHIYGKETSGRYVCESRVAKMLDREYKQLVERLNTVKGENTCFFAFANTVAIRNFHGTNEAHGWMGIRFKHSPGATEVSEAVVHCRLFDNSPLQQQDAIGTLGVNVIYASFYKSHNSQLFVKSLMDNISRARVEIDMIKVSGPAFAGNDNRLIDLELVKQGHTDAVLFDAKGVVQSISESLYKKNLLVARGSYRPPTLVNTDLMKTSMADFCQVNSLEEKDVTVLAEITISQLDSRKGEIDTTDFLQRLDILQMMGISVLISNYKQYYKLSSFFHSFKCKRVGIVLGIFNFFQIFDKEYNDPKTGLLESLGQLFRDQTQVYVYPSIGDKGEVINLENIKIPDKFKFLHQHFLHNNQARDLKNYDKNILAIYSRKVLEMIEKGEEGWEKLLPKEVADLIKEKKYFGLK